MIEKTEIIDERSISHISNNSNNSNNLNNENLHNTVLADTKHGFSLYLPNDEPVITPTILKTKDWEYDVVKFIQDNLKPGHTFIDAGAFVGYFSILASKIVGINGKVYAFEPSEENYQLLLKNIEFNGCKNVIPIKKALSSSSCTVELLNYGTQNYTSFRSIVSPSERDLIDPDWRVRWKTVRDIPTSAFKIETVEAVRLDEVVGHADLIKIDVEGGERLVLEGASKLFESNPKIIIEEINHSNVSSWLVKEHDFVVLRKTWGNCLMGRSNKVANIYKIRSSMLQVKYSILDGSEHEQPIHRTLAMYDKGKDISFNSPFLKAGQWVHHRLANGVYDIEIGKKRQQQVIDLYESIKRDGYNGSLIYAWFDRDGFPHVYDGFHRISILNYLGMDVPVNVTTNLNKDWAWCLIKDPDFIYRFGDFPLAEVLLDQPPSRNWIYHPINDSRVSEFKVARPDSPNRLEYILDNLVGNTVLDIGCAEGYFSREIAKRGYKVVGLDIRRDLVAISRYLSVLEGVDVEYRVGDWGSIIQEYEHFDNILFMSVLHNEMKDKSHAMEGIGVDAGIKKLGLLKGKTDRLFFEVPGNSGETQWNVPGFPSYDFSTSMNSICNHISMVNIGCYDGGRKMYQLGSSDNGTVGVVEKDVVPAVSSTQSDSRSRPESTDIQDNLDGLVLNDNVNGYPMYMIESDTYITDAIYHGTYEPKTIDWIKKNVKPGQVFVDIGANVGIYTILASKLVGDSGKVYAFEPSTRCFDVLTRNVRLNNCNNVSLFRIGLGNKNTLSKLYKPNDSSYGQQYIDEVVKSKDKLGSSRYDCKTLLASDKYEDIIINRLDSLLSSPPDIIKVDTEGAEKLVLEGVGDLLSGVDTVLIEDHDGTVCNWFINEYGKYGFVVTVRKYDHYTAIVRRVNPASISDVESNTGRIVHGSVTKPRIHLLGLPYTKTVQGETLCAFTNLVYRMAAMLKDIGIEAYHYGVEGSDPPNAEQVDVLSEDIFNKARGDFDPTKELYKPDGNHYSYKTFRVNTISEIRKRLGPQDMILVSGGTWQKEISDAFPKTPSIEFIVGYIGCYAKYKVFPSYAWMHHLYGKNPKLTKVEGQVIMGNWYDAVIPHYLDPNEFEYSEDKDDYYLFIGRLIRSKGVHVAVDMCKKLGAKIVVAGQPQVPKGHPQYDKIMDELGLNLPHVEYVGTIGQEERNKLMSRAKAVIVPSMYLEPFGLVVVESMLCGTPVITTDWGSFPEIVPHGDVGYRCRTMDDFLWACRNVDSIESSRCREYAVANFSMDVVALKYKEYFMKIQDLYAGGWYQERPDRENLDWLRRY